MLKDEPAQKKTGLAEQRGCGCSSGRKRGFVTFGRRSGQLKRTAKM